MWINWGKILYVKLILLVLRWWKLVYIIVMNIINFNIRLLNSCDLLNNDGFFLFVLERVIVMLFFLFGMWLLYRNFIKVSLYVYCIREFLKIDIIYWVILFYVGKFFIYI